MNCCERPFLGFARALPQSRLTKGFCCPSPVEAEQPVPNFLLK
jgi:hypothetical protein